MNQIHQKIILFYIQLKTKNLNRKGMLIMMAIGFNFCLFSQPARSFETLDRFFAGTPLQEGFDKWHSYFTNNPYLGIDSTNRMGNHSSFKPGIKSYFPFPDSTVVKIIFKKTLLMDVSTRQFVDSMSTIEVRGIFGKNKPAKKESRKFYKGVRKELMRFYKYEFRDYEGQSSWFYRGKSANFLNCSLHFGTNEKTGEHYVQLVYSDQKNQQIKTYPPPDKTLRH